MTAVIEARHIHKTYESGPAAVCALADASLTARKGDFIAIMGPSGSGKTTLMNILGCLDTPTSGSLLVDGDDVSGADDAALSYIRATKIGFVFQIFNLIPQLTVYENVELPLLYGRFAEDAVQDKTLRAIERVGLSHRIEHRPAELSGGEMQRVAIARALVIDPVIILADEPTGNLDTNTGDMILEDFQRLNNQGVTVIIVTHDDHVARRARRTMTIRDGRLEAPQ